MRKKQARVNLMLRSRFSLGLIILSLVQIPLCNRRLFSRLNSQSHVNRAQNAGFGAGTFFVAWAGLASVESAWARCLKATTTTTTTTRDSFHALFRAKERKILASDWARHFASSLTDLRARKSEVFLARKKVQSFGSNYEKCERKSLSWRKECRVLSALAAWSEPSV